ncbi:MAG: hypothetical protein AABZ47_03400 [Planctomycetota bacterium]
MNPVDARIVVRRDAVPVAAAVVGEVGAGMQAGAAVVEVRVREWHVRCLPQCARNADKKPN